ncbi:MAG: valine--tRNA ligase [Gammaproteobacteria bacterium]|nr:valine--tRNA ligase [Gammaproteobacteria bacterium]
MERTYAPEKIERRIYVRWEEGNYFAPRGEGRPWCIMLPPPNVTGTLHMGHAFQHTLMDALARYQRMRGRRVLWQGGTDHAGIATQMVVERQLQAEGINRHELGRAAFVNRVELWQQESGGTITAQMRRMGDSVDWSRMRFTLDADLCDAVTEEFVRLYEEGLIYRGKRLVNWDPALGTALSDLEVINEEEQGEIWHIRYPLADGGGEVEIATTRPETMLGDTAVAVHPEDERYHALVGKTIRLPLTDRIIPIVADEYVDPEFGSGCVKITPAHDFNDQEVGRRHGLPRINILAADATILEAAQVYQSDENTAGGSEPLPEAYRGLDRFTARRKIVADLERNGLLIRSEAHTLKVPRGDRSGAVIEPLLTDQWFVDLTRESTEDGRPGGRAAIVQPAIDAVRTGRIRFVPGGWSKTYFQWLENIQDWCISRQLWWGHRIPAWYDEAGNVYVGRDEAEARDQGGLAPDVPLRRDEDVLGTWFSSALWPFSTLGWPKDTEELADFYPTDVLITGFDIIFFWVARMAMMGLHFTGKVPFRDVAITGLIRDEHGQKMSKSKGNVLDPIDLIDGIELEPLVAKRTARMLQPRLAERVARETRKRFPDGIPAFGTDALRFTFTALASTGRDISFDLGRIGGYRNFCNKLWNATRFVLMHVQVRPDFDVPLEPADRWIRSRLAHTANDLHEQFAAYRFDFAAQALYDFTWSEFCDWYLELAKERLNAGAESSEAARATLITVLEGLLRALHPIMPFITEALWQQVAPLAGKGADSVMLTRWPDSSEFEHDSEAETEIAWLQAVVSALRRLRSELGLDPALRIPVSVHGANAQTRARLATHGASIAFLARTDTPPLASDAAAPEAAVTAVVGEATLALPLAGVIDVAAELDRLDKTLAKLQAQHEQSRKKLANDKFTSRAPAEVVARERERLAEAETEMAHYSSQREHIATIRGHKPG